MRLNIISIVGFLIVFYLIRRGLDDYGNRSLKTTAVILEVGEKIPVKDKNGNETEFLLPLKLKYTSGGYSNEYIEDVKFFFNNNDDISKYSVVGRGIDIYLNRENSRVIGKEPISDESPVLIPLSYILLIGVCYYTFKN